MKLSKLTFGQYTYLLIVVTATIRAFMKFGTYYYFKMFYLPPTSNLKEIFTLLYIYYHNHILNVISSAINYITNLP